MEPPSPRRKHLEHLAKFQAILAGLPMHALRAEHGCDACCCTSRRGGCLCCCHPSVIQHMPWVLPCGERIEVALLGARHDYPQFRQELGRLRVAHASHDLTIFVDDEGERMFTSLRGTDCGTCRDLSNDTLIFFGCWLCRTKWAREEYCHTRAQYPRYCSYGCGHSLGGTVITELAHLVEKQEEYAFKRVDVFNTGGSPISRGYTSLKITEFNAHRVKGDWISKYFRGPGEVHEHPRRPEFCSHSLQHFLPDKISDGVNSYFPSVDGCCGVRGRARTASELNSLSTLSSISELSTEKRQAEVATEDDSGDSTDTCDEESTCSDKEIGCKTKVGKQAVDHSDDPLGLTSLGEMPTSTSAAIAA